MARVVAFLFGLMLCLSVSVGSVAHAAEGPMPLESSCAVMYSHEDDGGSGDTDKALSQGHACHGHHVGVPHFGVAAAATPELVRVLIASTERALPSIRARTPIRPPRA
ncbi:MAG: hypothetical protein ACTHKR_14900 [Sphingomonas sp.]